MRYRLLSIVAAILAAGAVAHADQTEESFPLRGGSGGGSEFQLRCNGYPRIGNPDDIYVVGVAGYVGAWVDRFWLLCGNGRGGYLIDAPTLGKAGNGNGGE